jgi:DNA polymerase-3 subunit epsilon
LGSLVKYKRIPNDGTFHRALADAEMTTHLWMGFLDEIENRYGINQITISFMQKLSRVTAKSVDSFFEKTIRNNLKSRDHT